MIVVKEFPNREFVSKEELFAELKANKKALISLKKATDKRADSIDFVYSVDKSDEANKEDTPITQDINQLRVKVVINTTNLLDSHNDLHVNGIWNKTLSDNGGKGFLHLQEHERDFDKVISDNAKGSVESLTWKSLGYSYNGKTEALIFDSVIDKKRNEFMFNQYANGWVKNHSVGMKYVKVDLAINSEAEWDKEEKAIWDKYYPSIANKEVAYELGYFWAVQEAKIVEGSAVVMGSNSATPTLSVETKSEDEPNNKQDEPINHSLEIENEPTEVTHENNINLNLFI